MHPLLRRHIKRGPSSKFPTSRIATLPPRDRAALPLTGKVYRADWPVLLADPDEWVREVAWQVYGPVLGIDELARLGEHSNPGAREHAMSRIRGMVQAGAPGRNLVSALLHSEWPDVRAFGICLVSLMVPAGTGIKVIEIDPEMDLDF